MIPVCQESSLIHGLEFFPQRNRQKNLRVRPELEEIKFRLRRRTPEHEHIPLCPDERRPQMGLTL